MFAADSTEVRLQRLPDGRRPDHLSADVEKILALSGFLVVSSGGGHGYCPPPELPRSTYRQTGNQRATRLAADFGRIVLLSLAAAAFGKSNRESAVRVDFRSSPKYACVKTIGNDRRPP